LGQVKTRNQTLQRQKNGVRRRSFVTFAAYGNAGGRFGKPTLSINVNRLGRHSIHFGSEARFVPRRGVLMKHALLNRSIDDRYGFPKHRPRFFAIAAFDRGSQLFDLSAQMASVAAVYFIAPLGLSNSLLC
jgi:hypothetical protein